MNIQDLYPKFKTTDMWGREIEITARPSLYTRKIISSPFHRKPINEEQPISKVQFALILLNKIEELYEKEHGPTVNPNDNPPIKDSDNLVDFFNQPESK